MKKLFLIPVLFAASFLSAQTWNINVGGLPIQAGASVPASCATNGTLFFKNTITTGWYFCQAGTFVAFGTGTGTITSVNGTANQIIVTGTTTPTLSVSPALIFPGTISSAQVGAASAPAATFSGAPFTGGSGTTTFPLVYLNSGAAPSSWATSGTIFGINAPSGFAGNLVDYHLNGGGSLWLVSSGGATNQAGGATFGAATSLTFSGRSKVNSSADGLITFQNNAGTSITRLNLGLNTSSGPAICVSGTTVTGCLGDGTAGGTWDFSGVSQVKLPVAAGYASVASGEIGWDSTQVWPHLWASAPAGAADLKVFMQQASEVDAASFRSGSTTCGIQEAIDAMPFSSTEGGVVHVHGVCNTATQITIRATSGGADTVTLQGDGPNGTIINYSGTGTTGVIKIGGAGYVTRNVTIKGMNIGCGGALACIGINAIRTKNTVIDRVLFDNNSAVAAANTSACIVLDGGTGDFTAFTHVSNIRCLNGWKDGVRQIGSGANEASSNNNLYENNEFTQVNTPAVGIAYDFQTGGGNVILGGDIQGYATGVKIAGRANIFQGFIENTTTSFQFDNSTYGAAEYNMTIGYCTPTCTILDNGRNNVIFDPVNGQPPQSSPTIFWLSEDFDSANCANTTAGRNGWTSTNASAIAAIANHPGICELTTTASSGTIGRLHASDNTIYPQGQSWKVVFVAKDASAALTNSIIRIGLLNPVSVDPTDGLYFENVTVGSATNWTAVARKASTSTTTSCSPTSTLDGGWHKFEISNDGSDNIRFRIDNAACAVNANSNVPIVALGLAFQVKNSAAETKLLHADFASMWMKTNR